MMRKYQTNLRGILQNNQLSSKVQRSQKSKDKLQIQRQQKEVTTKCSV